MNISSKWRHFRFSELRQITNEGESWLALQEDDIQYLCNQTIEREHIYKETYNCFSSSYETLTNIGKCITWIIKNWLCSLNKAKDK